MSGNGNKKGSGGNSKKGSSGGSNNQGGVQQQQQPTIVSGWQYHQYAQNSNRYAYIGKDEDTGEPEFLDYGPQGGR